MTEREEYEQWFVRAFPRDSEGRGLRYYATCVQDLMLEAYQGGKIAAPVSVAEPVANKPIGYVTSFGLTHVLVHGGHIPMHPEPVSLATVPVYLAAQPAADNAPQAPSASSVPAAMGMLRCLQYVECVYRLNCVAEGEPSSTLKYMQDVIAANAQGSSATNKEAL